MPDQFISALRGYLRLNNFPLDASSIFDSISNALVYASTDPSAYAGQYLSVIDTTNKVVKSYVLIFPEDIGISGYILKEIFLGDYGDISEMQEELLRIAVIVDGLTATETLITSSKTISAPNMKVNIIEDQNDVTNVEYVDQAIAANLHELEVAIEKNTSFTISNIGGSGGYITANMIIKRIIITITQSYEEPLRCYLNGIEIIHDDLIIENIDDDNESSINIIDLNRNYGIIGNISIFPVNTSSTGTGLVVIEYTTLN